MTLGDILKQYRYNNGISMDEFSKRSGLSKGYISMLENNINPRNNKPIAPTLPTVQKIASGMNFDVDTLLKMLDKEQEISLDNSDVFSPQILLSEQETSYIEKYRFISEYSTSLARLIRDSIDTGYDIAVLLKDKDSYIEELESQLHPSSNSKESKTEETIDFVEQKIFSEVARQFEERKRKKQRTERNDAG